LPEVPESPERQLPEVPESPRSAEAATVLEEKLSYEIVGAFFDVYNELGPGLLESIYSKALEIALRDRGLRVEREHPVTVYFRAQEVGTHRIDMLVERRVILELKSTERLPLTAADQLRSYLAVTRLELGIILHFGPKARFYRQLRGWKQQSPE
jgi:GxxExxY protein